MQELSGVSEAARDLATPSALSATVRVALWTPTTSVYKSSPHGRKTGYPSPDQEQGNSRHRVRDLFLVIRRREDGNHEKDIYKESEGQEKPTQD